MSALAVLLAGALFTTPVADRPDEPIARVALPSNWKLYPFVDTEPAPALTEGEKVRGFLLYGRPITAPVYRFTHPRPDERLERLDAFAARGERAQLTFAVYAGRDLASFAASAALPFPGELRQITYSPNRLSRYTDVGKARERPAYLVPAARTPLAVGENLRYVLTLAVPADAAPGVHTGEVTLGFDGLAEPVRVPISLTVLPFALKRDPAKTYTAYASHKYDLKRMVEYGFTTLPTIYINYDAAADRMIVRDIDELIARFRALGGPAPDRLIALMNVNGMLYRKYMGKMPVKRPQTDMPPDAFFDHLERLGRAFLADWRARGLPALYVIGADEPEASNMAYVSRLYRTIKAAGFQTYVTSWTDNHDAYAPIDPYVDVYCEQLHQDAAMLAASGKREHWCYPNHSAYELKDAATQSRGGRMTYGFGFWRSSDTVLVPWAWSWTMDYTKVPGLSLGGQRLKDDGTEWIEWEWEAFVAGTIDEAYVYTLQDAIFRREGADCAAARAALQRIRSRTPFRRKYLADNHWNDSAFDAARCELADAILSLQGVPETREGVCPSVLPGLVDAPEASADFSALESAGLLRRFAVPAKKAHPIEPGCKVKALADGTVVSDISIDREHGNVNGYACTTPSIGFGLDPKLDLAQYGYVTYKLRVKSNRDADHAALWPYQLLFSAQHPDGRRLHAAVDMPSSVPPDQWQEFAFPLASVGLPPEVRDRVNSMRFYFEERDYETGDELHLEIKDLAFIGARLPVMTRLAAIPVRRGSRDLAYECDFFGLTAGAALPARITVSDSAGKTLASVAADFRRADEHRWLRLPDSLPAGRYTLKVELLEGDNVYQTLTDDFTVVRF